jgi:protein MpaA
MAVVHRRFPTSPAAIRHARGAALLTAVAALLLPACQAPQRTTSATTTIGPGDERRILLGESRLGRPLELFILGDEPAPLLVIGGIHGDEPTSATVAWRLLERLRAAAHLRGGLSVAILPEANPDGLLVGTRTNAVRVDCNRNFPATNWSPTAVHRYHGGTQPASEPETRAIMQAVSMLRPRAIISIHAIGGGREMNNYDGPGRWLAQVLHAHNGYPVSSSIGYPTPGSFGTWAGVDLGYPTVTLELPARASADEAWLQNEAALLTAIRSLPALAE